MANISKLNVQGTAYDLRDAASLHYKGHFTAGLTEGAAGTYTGTPTGLSNVAKFDYITYGDSNLNLVCTNISDDATPVITWTSTSEITAAPNNATITVAVTGETDQTFTVNQSENQTINVNVPVKGVQVNGTDLTPDSSTHKVNINSIPASILETGTTITAGVLTGNLSASSADGEIANKKYVDDSIADIPSPMIFKGTAGTSGTYVPDDAATGDKVPAASGSGATKNTGWTIKVITDGTYAGVTAENGDVLVSTGAAWILIPSGDEPDGTVTSISVEADENSNLVVELEDETTHSTTDISTSGTITVGVATGYEIPATTDITAWNGAVTKVADYTDNNAVVTGISNTTSAGASSVAIGEVGTGADAETLFINPLYFTSDSSAVFDNAT